jgi:hypothetical protein
METHCNSQRRLYDDQCSLARTPVAPGQAHQACLRTANTTAHQGLLKDRRRPPRPVEVLGEAKGRLYAPDERARAFSQGVCPRTTNRYGCVTLPSYHLYGEEGLPPTRVLLWGAGASRRAAFENVVLAESHGRYDWQERKVKDIQGGIFYPTRLASPPGALMPLTPQESLVVYRPHPPRRRAPRLATIPPLLRFEVVPTGSGRLHSPLAEREF